jgi:hypothetical protein
MSPPTFPVACADGRIRLSARFRGNTSGIFHLVSTVVGDWLSAERCAVLGVDRSGDPQIVVLDDTNFAVTIEAVSTSLLLEGLSC